MGTKFSSFCSCINSHSTQTINNNFDVRPTDIQSEEIKLELELELEINEEEPKPEINEEVIIMRELIRKRLLNIN
jgi:hypothetical protein